MGKKGHNRLNRIGDALELPSGLLSGGAHIELRGNREAVIDGRCTVLEYSDCVIRLNTGSGMIKFCGKGLQLGALDADSAVITGIIATLDFTD